MLIRTYTQRARRNNVYKGSSRLLPALLTTQIIFFGALTLQHSNIKAKLELLPYHMTDIRETYEQKLKINERSNKMLIGFSLLTIVTGICEYRRNK